LPIGVLFDVRYNLGLSNIGDSDVGDVHNIGLMLGAGYRF
jgi:hypothetical protein